MRKIQLKDLHNTITIQGTICDKKEETKLRIGFNTHNRPDFEKLINVEFNKPLNKKKLSLALLDKDGGVIIDEKGSYKFDREGTQSIIDYIDELNDKVVDFEFYVTKFKDLSAYEVSMFCKVIETDNNIKSYKYLKGINQDVFDKMSLFIEDLPEFKENFEIDEVEDKKL